MKNKLNLRQGMDMPHFGRGVVSGDDANELLVKPIQAFVKMQIVTGKDATGKLVLSDSNAILQLPNPTLGGGGGGGSGVITVFTVTGVNSDTWQCGSTVVYKPWELRCSITGANADIYDASGNHTLLAAAFTYDGTYQKRVVAVTGYQNETAYVEPAMQPLLTYAVSSSTPSGGNSSIVTSPSIPTSTGMIVGTLIFYPGGSATVTATTVSGGNITSFIATGLFSPATVSLGGTQIAAMQDGGGNWYDLNVASRAWSEVALIPNP